MKKQKHWRGFFGLRHVLLIGFLSVIAFTFIQCSNKNADPIVDKVVPDKPTVPITPKSGMDLYGFIGDENGAAIAGVIVSDGFTCTVTDSKGVYQMKKNKKAAYVYYTTPASYAIKVESATMKMATFHQAIREPTERYDFALQTLPAVEDKFTLVAIADPQVRTSGDLERFEKETMPDVRKVVQNISGPVYGIALGDIMFDIEEYALPARRLLGMGDIPMFVAIGNHDKFATADNPVRNETFFSSVYGPTNYSFDRGNAHFICMDNVIFSSDGSYVAGFTDEQVEWLRQNLQYVPKSKMVVLYYHIPLRNTASFKNRDKVLALLNGFSEVHLMAGHTHYHENFDVTLSLSAYEHIHGAACGAWWKSVINGDGTPNGYSVYQINGNTMEDWYYKAVNFDRNHQMRLYRGDGLFGGIHGYYTFGLVSDVLVANIWNADKDWTVSVYEDGVKTGEMTRSSTVDRDYWAQGYHIGVLKNVTYTQVARHMYTYVLKNPDSEIKVVAKDGFGNEYTETEITLDVATAGQYFQ